VDEKTGAVDNGGEKKRKDEDSLGLGEGKRKEDCGAAKDPDPNPVSSGVGRSWQMNSSRDLGSFFRLKLLALMLVPIRLRDLRFFKGTRTSRSKKTPLPLILQASKVTRFGSIFTCSMKYRADDSRIGNG
jgi:hypothetical protein